MTSIMKYLSPLLSSEKDQTRSLENSERETPLLSMVESFVDLNIARSRTSAIDNAIVSRFQEEFKTRLSSESIEELSLSLSQILAEIKADIHYLGAAYISEHRYNEPNFNFQTPKDQDDKPMPQAFEIDLRGQITGGNWYYAEGDGRWAGPESESSLLFPALEKGEYQIEVKIVDEIESGVIDGMEVLVNGERASFTRDTTNLPTTLQISAAVPKDYKFPFWSLKFQFGKLRSPASINGSDDKRTLAVRMASVKFSKVVA